MSLLEVPPSQHTPKASRLGGKRKTNLSEVSTHHLNMRYDMNERCYVGDIIQGPPSVLIDQSAIALSSSSLLNSKIVESSIPAIQMNVVVVISIYLTD